MTDRYDYDAFGVLTFHTGATVNAFLYCGEESDGDLGLYYLRARYLNSESGRFWTMDPFEGFNDVPTSLHAYSFANANPSSFVDPSGCTTLVEVVSAASISIGLQIARIGPAFAVGGAAIGRVWNQLGIAAQRSAESVMLLFGQLQIERQALE